MKICHHLVLLLLCELRLFLREQKVQEVLSESLFVEGRYGYLTAFGNAAD